MKNTMRPRSWKTSRAMMFLAVAAVLFLLGSASPVSDKQERNIYRSDVLTFQGDRTIAVHSLPSDSFLVILNRRSSLPGDRSSSPYSVILRGIDPVERALLHDAENGQWERFDLFRAAMIAEGIRDIELIRAYEARLDALAAKVLQEIYADCNAGQQADRFTEQGQEVSQTLFRQQILMRALFEAMHREILTRQYSIDCTELSKVMETGRFNCVSATILFNCLAEKAGLNVSALEMPGHALSRVRFADGTFMNIETTCPTWFELQSEQERQLATLQRIAPQSAAPSPLPGEVLSRHREISPVQLIATVYYNIGVDHHAKQRHAEAAAANIKALYLDKDNEQAWTNLLVSLNNWALDAASEESGRKYDLAAFLLDQGVALDPSYDKFRTNYTYVFYLWIRDLTHLGRFDDARKVFELANAENRIPNDEFLRTLIGKVNKLEKEQRK